MSNVLSEEKRQQVIALGRLGWPLRRIQQETGIRRETAGAYLKAAGVAIRAPGGWGRRSPAKPANEVSPDPPPAGSGQNRPTVSPDSAPVATARTQSHGQCLRAVLRLHRTVAQQGAKRQGDLPGLGGQPRLHGALRQRQALCRPVAWAASKIGVCGHRHATRRGSAGGYGSGPMVRDSHTGRYRRTRLFVPSAVSDARSVGSRQTRVRPASMAAKSRSVLTSFWKRRQLR